MNEKKAIEKINANGILLVFPINNKPEPKSLWSEFYPRSKMHWAWDEGGDNRVGLLWSLMKSLSATKSVVYTKWYQGRATFFSKELFCALLCMYQKSLTSMKLLRSAKDLLEALENNSPLSTKQLKKQTDLRGKDNEANYNRSMKQLFSTMQIIAFGEVDDGAFPSLAVGATRHIFEDLWQKASKMSATAALKIINNYMPKDSLTRKFYNKTMSQFEVSVSANDGDLF